MVLLFHFIWTKKSNWDRKQVSGVYIATIYEEETIYYEQMEKEMFAGAFSHFCDYILLTSCTVFGLFHSYLSRSKWIFSGFFFFKQGLQFIKKKLHYQNNLTSFKSIKPVECNTLQIRFYIWKIKKDQVGGEVRSEAVLQCPNADIITWCWHSGNNSRVSMWVTLLLLEPVI